MSHAITMGTPAGDQKSISKTVTINAPASQVWDMLTTPELMAQWMASDMEISINTDWQVGNPMVIRGNMNGKHFENTGTVLQFDPEKAMQYSHLSSLSRLPDQPENYAIIAFSLNPVGSQTSLTVTLRQFATESIYKHLAFYWNVALEVLKRLIEEAR